MTAVRTSSPSQGFCGTSVRKEVQPRRPKTHPLAGDCFLRRCTGQKPAAAAGNTKRPRGKQPSSQSKLISGSQLPRAVLSLPCYIPTSKFSWFLQCVHFIRLRGLCIFLIFMLLTLPTGTQAREPSYNVLHVFGLSFIHSLSCISYARGVYMLDCESGWGYKRIRYQLYT